MKQCVRKIFFQEPFLFKKNGSLSHIRQENSISGADERPRHINNTVEKSAVKGDRSTLINLAVCGRYNCFFVSHEQWPKKENNRNIVISATTAGKNIAGEAMITFPGNLSIPLLQIVLYTDLI